RWIAGADGGNSMVRRWAGLDAAYHQSTRYGFRRHYRIAPWTDFMEIYWADSCQLYITPVSESEICVVVLSRDSNIRLEQALPLFPDVQRRLSGVDSSSERGAVTMSRRLHNVWKNNVALVGDASGS